MVLGCISSFPCTIRKVARDYHHIEVVPNNLKNKRFPAYTPISTSWEKLCYSRKHSRTHLSSTEACALLQRGHTPRAEGGKLSPGLWMVFPAFFFSFFGSISPLSHCYQIELSSNNPQSLILLLYTATVPSRARPGQPQASYGSAGKEGKHQGTKTDGFLKENQCVPWAL